MKKKLRKKSVARVSGHHIQINVSPVHKTVVGSEASTNEADKSLAKLRYKTFKE